MFGSSVLAVVLTGMGQTACAAARDHWRGPAGSDRPGRGNQRRLGDARRGRSRRPGRQRLSRSIRWRRRSFSSRPRQPNRPGWKVQPQRDKPGHRALQEKVMALAPSDFTFVQTLIRQQAAIDLKQRQELPCRNPHGGLAGLEGFKSIEELVAQVAKGTPCGSEGESGGGDYDATNLLLSRIKPFEALGRSVLPELFVKRGRPASCGSGVRLPRRPRSRTASPCCWRTTSRITCMNIQILATDLETSSSGAARADTKLEVNQGCRCAVAGGVLQPERGVGVAVRGGVRSIVQLNMLNLDWPLAASSPPRTSSFSQHSHLFQQPHAKANPCSNPRASLAPMAICFWAEGDDSQHRPP